MTQKTKTNKEPDFNRSKEKTIKNKRFLSVLFVVIMVLSCCIACTATNEKTLSPDEEKISQRIEIFLTSYNDGDTDRAISCLDAEKQAMWNLLSGFVGGMTDGEMDLSDVVSITSEEFTKFEITDIDITDSLNAIAATALTGAKTQTVYFIMVYENNDWYIHDTTDKKPDGAVNDAN